jgi:hypothetical protein
MLSLPQRTPIINHTGRYVICLHFNVTIELNMADKKQEYEVKVRFTRYQRKGSTQSS